MLLIFLFKINDLKKLARFYYALYVRASKNSQSSINSIGVNMKSTRAEYLNFFTNWLHYQFPRNADIVHNVLIIREVRLIVDTDSEAAYWGDRDCWTMHDIANKRIQARAIEAVTA
jgi:hypothetical protein